MNFRNDWVATLKMANEELEKLGMQIRVLHDVDEGTYSCDINDGFEWINFAENYYEHELGGLVYDAWAHARAKAKATKRKPVTVWVVTFLNDCEYELPNVSVSVFGTEDEARKCLDGEWQTLTSEHEYDEDCSKKSDDDFFFEDDCANRTIGEIKKREVTIKQ